MFSFGFSLFLLRLIFFRLRFFEVAFHLVLSLVSVTIGVVELLFCSNVPAIGVARLVLVHRLQTCRASVSSASLVLRRVGIVATLGREIVVFRLLPSSGRTYPVSITGRNTVVTQFPSTFFWHHMDGPIGTLSLFSVTLSLALRRMNRLKVCLLFLVFFLSCK